MKTFGEKFLSFRFWVWGSEFGDSSEDEDSLPEGRGLRLCP